MKISACVAAAIAAGVMSLASSTSNTFAQSNAAVATTVPPTGQEVGLLKRFLLAGRADPEAASNGNTAENRRVTTASVGKVEAPYHSIVSLYAAHYGVPVSLAHAVIRLESNYRPSARGRAGEIGLMQIKPSTARAMGYGGSSQELYAPETNIKYGMKYLGEAFRLGGGDTCASILKYNAGHAAKRMNAVSTAYCAKVKRLLGED